jgi:hypothetical protein
MSERLTGQGVEIHVFKGNVLAASLTLIKECTITAEQSVSRENYLGYNQELPDGKFDIFKIEFASHQDNADWIDFVDLVVQKQQGLPGAPTSINMACNLKWPNGQIRSVVLSGLEFGSVSIGITGRKEMVENGFEAFASKHKFLN